MEKWQQKFNLSHLKEIQKQYVEVITKFLSVLFGTCCPLNQPTVCHLGLILNLITFINYVLVTSQEG